MDKESYSFILNGPGTSMYPLYVLNGQGPKPGREVTRSSAGAASSAAAKMISMAPMISSACTPSADAQHSAFMKSTNSKESGRSTSTPTSRTHRHYTVRKSAYTAPIQRADGNETTRNRSAAGEAVHMPVSTLCGDVTADQHLVKATSYILACTVFVTPGVTIKIDPGVTITAAPGEGAAAPGFIVMRGAAIVASGTASEPVTFTALLPEQYDSGTVVTDSRKNVSIEAGLSGKWGGLVLLGGAPTAEITPRIEGLPSGHGARGAYGGTDPHDSSGLLSYVRVWHCGAIIGSDNELNGITFGGVGDGTVVEHCEVAFSLDDGFEWFGGTVNVRWLSALFIGDDSFDFDHGYVGSAQFLFSLLGVRGDHGFEVDSETSPDGIDAQPRTVARLGSVTIIGGGEHGRQGALALLREGTAGLLSAAVLVGSDKGVQVKECSEQVTLSQRGDDLRLVLHESETPEHTHTTPTAGHPDSLLYIDPHNLVSPGVATPLLLDASCARTVSVGAFGAANVLTMRQASALGLVHVNESCLDYSCEITGAFSALPLAHGAACAIGWLAPPPPASSSANWSFSNTSCYGAFANPTDDWLEGWSWLAYRGASAPSPPPLMPPSPTPLQPDRLPDASVLLDFIGDQPALVGGLLILIAGALVGLVCFAAQKLRSVRTILRLVLSLLDLATDVLFLVQLALLHVRTAARSAVSLLLYLDVCAFASVALFGIVCVVWRVSADSASLDGAKLQRYAPMYTILASLAIMDLELLRLLPWKVTEFDGFASTPTMVAGLAHRMLEAVPQAALSVAFLSLDASANNRIVAVLSLTLSFLTLLHVSCRKLLAAAGHVARSSPHVRRLSVFVSTSLRRTTVAGAGSWKARGASVLASGKGEDSRKLSTVSEVSAGVSVPRAKTVSFAAGPARGAHTVRQPVAVVASTAPPILAPRAPSAPPPSAGSSGRWPLPTSARASGRSAASSIDVSRLSVVGDTWARYFFRGKRRQLQELLPVEAHSASSASSAADTSRAIGISAGESQRINACV